MEYYSESSTNSAYEAFTTLRQFFGESRRQAKSETMSKIRSKVGKDVFLCSDQGCERTSRDPIKRMSTLDEFHTPSSDPVTVCTCFSHFPNYLLSFRKIFSLVPSQPSPIGPLPLNIEAI